MQVAPSEPTSKIGRKELKRAKSPSLKLIIARAPTGGKYRNTHSSNNSGGHIKHIEGMKLTILKYFS